MRPIRFLLRKEFAQIFRDRVLVFQLLAVPVIQLLIVTSAATFEVRSVALHVVDRDRTPSSRQLLGKLTASGRFEVARSSTSGRLAGRDLESGAVGGVVEIPDGFARDLGRGGTAGVRLVFDGSKGPLASTALGYAERIVDDFAAGLPLDRGALPTVLAPGDPSVEGTSSASGSGAGLEVRTRRWYNPTGDFEDHMSVGILVLLVTLVGTLMTALNITREREQGTLEQLNVSPLTKGQFIAGKLIPFWILGVVEFAVGLVVIHLAYDVPFRGGLGLVFVATSLYLLTALGLGLLISTASETQQQAQFLTFFLLVIYLFLSGLFTPVESMPEWAGWLAEANPIKHFIVVTRGVLLKGAGPGAMLVELSVLLAFAAVTLPVSVRVYSKTAG